MSKYEVIIYRSEEDNTFVAEVPELSGCMADGSTYQEALANAEMVIQEGSRRQPNWVGLFHSQKAD